MPPSGIWKISIAKLVPKVVPDPHHILPVLPFDVDLQQVVVAVDEFLRIPDTQHEGLTLPEKSRDISL